MTTHLHAKCSNILPVMPCYILNYLCSEAVVPGGPSAPGEQMEPAASNLVRCMLLRAAYGGMGGDVAMLRKFAALWQSRSALPTDPPVSVSGTGPSWCCSSSSQAVASQQLASRDLCAAFERIEELQSDVTAVLCQSTAPKSEFAVWCLSCHSG